MWQVERSVRHTAEFGYREAVATGRLVQPQGQLAVVRRRKVGRCGLIYGTSARASSTGHGDHFQIRFVLGQFWHHGVMR